MTCLSLACLLIATPTLAFGDPEQAQDWLSGELKNHWVEAQNQDAPRSWAVARVIAGDPLLQTRPIVRGQNKSLETEILRDMTHCTIAAHRYMPQSPASRPIVSCRYPQWAGVVVADGLVQRWSEHPEERKALKSALPDFLSRELTGKRAEALLFFAALGACFKEGHLSPLRSEPAQVVQALKAFDETLTEISQGTHDTSVWLTDGRVLYVMHHGPPLALCLGPKPDRSSQHTLRHKATEGAPSVLVTTTYAGAATSESASAIDATVFAVEAQRPTALITA